VKGEVARAVPNDAKYFARYAEAVKREADTLRSVFRASILAARIPPGAVPKTEQQQFSELSQLRQTQDPSFTPELEALWQKLARKFAPQVVNAPVASPFGQTGVFH